MQLTLYDVFEQKHDGSLDHLKSVRAQYPKKALAVALAGKRTQRGVRESVLQNRTQELERDEITPGNWVVIARNNQTGYKREDESK